MPDSVKVNAEIILNEHSTFGEIKSAIDQLYVNMMQMTKLTANTKKAEHGTILPEGEALSPKTAAGCIFDYIRTIKFLRGIKKAIDNQLKIKSKIKVMYVGTGPLAPLLLPLLPFYSKEQLEVSSIEFHKEAVDTLESIIDHFGYRIYFREIITDDAINYKKEEGRLFDVIIIETMQKALSVEPQVAITNHFSQYLAADGILIPDEIKISALLANLNNELSYSSNKWSDFWLSAKRKNSKNKRIYLSEIFVLDKNIRSRYNILQEEIKKIILPSIIVPDKIGNMKDVILLTEIVISDGIILSEEDETGLTKLYFDQNLGPAQGGSKINIAYLFGSYPRFNMEYQL